MSDPSGSGPPNLRRPRDPVQYLLSRNGGRLVRAAGILIITAIVFARPLTLSSGRGLAGLLRLDSLESVQELWWDDFDAVGVWVLITFLWLVVTGQFGFASLSRRDWPAVVPLALALIAREALALHSMGEIEPQFVLQSVRNRHSAVQWLFSLFFEQLSHDPFAFLMHVNGVLGALASVPLYLFVRQRANSRTAGMLAAAFFAVHPLVARLAPTDNPYSLMLFSWFSGLALLSAPELEPAPLWAGGCLLGIAAACRPDAFLCVAASLFLLDPRGLWAGIRCHPRAAGLATLLVSALLIFHFSFTLPPVMQPGPPQDPIELSAVMRGALGQTALTPPIFAACAAIGALAGLLNTRFRVALGAVIGAGLLILPYPRSFEGGWTVYHRYVPSCAMVAVAAGIGAAGVTALLRRWLSPSVAVLPALAVVLSVLVSQASVLRQSNAINQEFSMLRDHLAPGGRVRTECVLLTMLSHEKGDIDIHDFEPILPGMPMRHCNRPDEDCRRVAAEHDCVYFVRSLSCYYVENRPPFQPGTRTDDPLAWLDPTCRDLERSLDLSPVDERIVFPLEVWHFDERYRLFPRAATIGLYRVTSR